MEPTKLQILVAEVQGTAKSEFIGVCKQIPIRLQLDVFASVMALHSLISENQKTPRNKVLNDLMAIAVEQVVESLDEDTLRKFNSIASEYYENYDENFKGDLSDD
jgi:hypothetical protein